MISVRVVGCKRHRVHRGPLPPRYGSDNKRPVEIKLKAPQQLQEVLNIAKGALAEAKADQHADSDADSPTHLSIRSRRCIAEAYISSTSSERRSGARGLKV